MFNRVVTLGFKGLIVYYVYDYMLVIIITRDAAKRPSPLRILPSESILLVKALNNALHFEGGDARFRNQRAWPPPVVVGPTSDTQMAAPHLSDTSCWYFNKTIQRSQK